MIRCAPFEDRGTTVTAKDGKGVLAKVAAALAAAEADIVHIDMGSEGAQGGCGLFRFCGGCARHGALSPSRTAKLSRSAIPVRRGLDAAAEVAVPHDGRRCRSAMIGGAG